MDRDDVTVIRKEMRTDTAGQDGDEDRYYMTGWEWEQILQGWLGIDITYCAHAAILCTVYVDVHSFIHSFIHLFCK